MKENTPGFGHFFTLLFPWWKSNKKSRLLNKGLNFFSQTRNPANCREQRSLKLQAMGKQSFFSRPLKEILNALSSKAGVACTHKKICQRWRRIWVKLTADRFTARISSNCIYRFEFFWRKKHLTSSISAYYFFLDEKVTKNQGCWIKGWISFP